ncbi:protein phosphatase 1 regulatory subunit 36-like isoform 1-T1 [Glossina fuscipes fuscipes]
MKSVNGLVFAYFIEPVSTINCAFREKMLRVNTSNFVPKYISGRWVWNEEKEKFLFDCRKEASKEAKKDEFMMTNGFNFSTTLNQVHELIYRQEFQRPLISYDYDFITTQDVQNLVAFLAPSTLLSKSLVEFINTETVASFLKALIIYFQYFLQVVEFILIQRDEITGEKAILLNAENPDMQRAFSAHLQQYRLLVAREYSHIILGEGDTKKFYHIKPIVNISRSSFDDSFHEAFLAYCTQVVWITLHRRAYDIIDMEMNRLFRSEHFKLTKYPRYQFTKPEAQTLYGPNYKLCNYRTQNSPLIQELTKVDKRNLPILYIGKQKYRGNDLRIMQIELEYIVDSAQLSLIGFNLGILGHPKRLYNTLLRLDWEAVRKNNFSATYDPFGIFRQPHLEIPSLDEEKLRQYSETYDSLYEVKRGNEVWSPSMIRKWKKRDKIVKYFEAEGVISDVWVKCIKEVADTSDGPSVEGIVKKFLDEKAKLRKGKQRNRIA